MPAVRGESQGCTPQTTLASKVGKEGVGHESDGCLLIYCIVYLCVRVLVFHPAGSFPSRGKLPFFYP